MVDLDRRRVLFFGEPLMVEIQLWFWPLWWRLSKAWHGPALLDKLPGPGIRRIRLGKIPEGVAHIDVRRKTLGAWQTADTMGFFHALPELWPGWQTEVWEDRFQEHVSRCDGTLRVRPGAFRRC